MDSIFDPNFILSALNILEENETKKDMIITTQKKIKGLLTGLIEEQDL